MNYKHSKRHQFLQSEEEYSKPPWNVSAELDSSRDMGPKIRKHPGIDMYKARETAKVYNSNWKPVNKRFSFTTTTTEMWGSG